MFDYREFQQVFPAGAQLPYDRELQAEIENSRNIFGGVLFIDRVMNALGLSKGLHSASCPWSMQKTAANL